MYPGSYIPDALENIVKIRLFFWAKTFAYNVDSRYLAFLVFVASIFKNLEMMISFWRQAL